jgi:glycosyltransferase involved in cell wall biosynthesis
MRFHLVGFPHTQITKSFSSSAISEKLRNFARMMKACGHTVYLYAGDETDAPCDELVSCYTEEQRAEFVGDKHYTEASWDTRLPLWQSFITKAVEGIQARAEPHDFVCLSAGFALGDVVARLPELIVVEYCVGYAATVAKFRVFESYAWMHTLYGAITKGDATKADGVWYDAVIPSYIDFEQFSFRQKKGDYYLFIGRLLDRKGVQIAVDVCREANKRLIVAGPGQAPEGANHVGPVGAQVRDYLVSRAIAIFAPTIFIEPFGNVAIEAMACGTPVICTDWGGFTETVKHGVTGYRCRLFQEFIEATELVKGLSARKIRNYALRNYTMEVAAQNYEAYFTRLSTLWTGGWYARPPR